MIGLGIGLSPARLSVFSAGAAVAQMFSGTSGLWIDPARPGSLWQETAGTVPAISPGQPIGMARDFSGGGRQVIQATSTARPTYRVDIWGRVYVDFDGIDDYLAALLVSLGTSGRTLVMAMRKRSDAALGCAVETGTNWASTPGGFAIFAPHLAASPSIGSRAMPGAAQSTLTSGNILPAPTTNVVTQIIAADTHILRIDGVQRASGAPAGPMTAFNGTLNIGSRNGNQLYCAMDLYGLLVFDRVLSASELAQAERWAANRGGVLL